MPLRLRWGKLKVKILMILLLETHCSFVGLLDPNPLLGAWRNFWGWGGNLGAVRKVLDLGGLGRICSTLILILNMYLSTVMAPFGAETCYHF